MELLFKLNNCTFFVKNVTFIKEKPGRNLYNEDDLI
ncbi:hypothetical protein G3A_11380 [Bacillus sp. 17376]|nr:hypothetical protein G3A_11380 [Bacillus sp. 17376]